MILVTRQAKDLEIGMTVPTPGFGDSKGIITKVDKTSKPGFVTFWVKDSITSKYVVTSTREIVLNQRPV
jgi:hypothetical protein